MVFLAGFPLILCRCAGDDGSRSSAAETGAIFTAAGFAILDAGGVEFAADDMVFDAGEVFDPAATDQNN